MRLLAPCCSSVVQRSALVAESQPGLTLDDLSKGRSKISGKPSGTLAAIGLPPTWGMVRLSFGLETTMPEVTEAAAVLRDVVRELAGR